MELKGGKGGKMFLVEASAYAETQRQERAVFWEVRVQVEHGVGFGNLEKDDSRERSQGTCTPREDSWASETWLLEMEVTIVWTWGFNSVTLAWLSI